MPKWSDDLIEEMVAWRMGAAYDAELLDWRSQRCVFEREDMLRRGQLGCFVITPDLIEMLSPPSAPFLSPWKIPRTVEYHTLLRDLSPRFPKILKDGKELPIVAHVQDGNVFPFIEPHPREATGIVATLTPNRPARRRTARSEMIIVPRRHVLNRKLVPFASPVPWHERSNQIFWRGQLTGMRYDYHIDADIALRGIRGVYGFASDFLKRAQESENTDILEDARNYQRLRVVIDHRDHPDIDLGITDVTDERGLKLSDFGNNAFGFEVFKARLSPQDYEARLAKHKVRLSIPGNDSASSMYDDILSDAAVMMPTPFHEGNAYYGLVPGQHYIALKPDMSDLAEKLDWCRANDGLVREIALEGQRHASHMLDRETELTTLNRILERLTANTYRG